MHLHHGSGSSVVYLPFLISQTLYLCTGYIFLPALESSYWLGRSRHPFLSSARIADRRHHFPLFSDRNVEDSDVWQKYYGRENWLRPSEGCPNPASETEEEGGKETIRNTAYGDSSFETPSTQFQPDKPLFYDIGFQGVTLNTSELSLRLYSTLMGPFGDDEVLTREHAKHFALKTTALEATKALLKQNGLDFGGHDVIKEPQSRNLSKKGALDSILKQDAGLHILEETLESIYLVQDTYEDPTNSKNGFNSWKEAAQNWTPGQPFNIILRRVPTTLHRDTVEDLLQALDPDGIWRQEALDLGFDQNDLLSPNGDGEIRSISDMAAESLRRVRLSPRDNEQETKPYTGVPKQRGYKVLMASDLDAWWSEMRGLVENGVPQEQAVHAILDSPTVCHVMDALVSHGCLIIDVGDEAAAYFMDIWRTAERAFERIDETSGRFSIPSLNIAADVDFNCVKSTKCQGEECFETRWRKGLKSSAGAFSPGSSFLWTAKDIEALQKASQYLIQVGKAVSRSVLAACTAEVAKTIPFALPSDFDIIKSAQRATDELMDGFLETDESDNESSIPPLRFCRYNNPTADMEAAYKEVEVGGAQIDTSFVTLVPVGRVAGLEVFDESAERWYRPELTAYHHSLETEAINKEAWYARYVICMPGELLQLLSRTEVLASIHRKIRLKGARHSASFLMRCRPIAAIDANRYWGRASNELERECDGQLLSDICNQLQQTEAYR